ncbi:MAG: MmgE/PrpD family protein [Gammaproteobacteria bacterium AqS3]|nr:MmgE/PrpD family protein [Gammaproteobacteria bacterium AqS3]
MSCSGAREGAGVLAEFIAGRWQPPAAARTSARVFILDSLGVGLSGARLPWSADLLRLSRSWAGAPQASVWAGGDVRLPAPLAAMQNALQIHCQEFDCVHEEAVVHPMAVVLASAVGFAEAHPRPVSGAELIDAVCTGVEVAAVLGMASSGPMRFFRPGTCGALGAAAAMAHLAGLDAERSLHALSLTCCQLGGTMQAHLEGAQALPMQIGFAARNAVMAVEMARAGLCGPRQFLHGEFGFYRLFEQGGNWEDAAQRLGSGEIARISHKPFPSGRATHALLDGLLRLGGADLRCEVRAVRLIAPPLIVRLVDRPATVDMPPSTARLCAPYVGARLLLHGGVRVQDFDPARIAEGDWAEPASRISVRAGEWDDPNAMAPQRIEVELAGGEVRSLDIECALGAPQNPLSEARQLEKFHACAASIGLAGADAGRIVETVQRLDDLADIAELTRLLRLPAVSQAEVEAAR